MVAAAAMALSGCGTPDVAPSQPAASSAGVGGAPAPAPAPTPSTSTSTSPQPPGSALALLATLAVKGRAPRTGYDRALFGQTWADTDRNGCDTRNDLLRRDLTDVVLQPGTRGCVVLTGTLSDPFSGNDIPFTRGQDSSDDVQIDHVVALSDAWQKGAQQWTPGRRVAFANDPLNLLAVDGSLNAAKNDGDAATWLPPHRPSRCAYVARQVAVKARYGAWVTEAERDAARVLGQCPGEAAPSGELPTESDVGAAAVLAPPPPAPDEQVAPPADAREGCDAAHPGVCNPAHDAGGDLACADVTDRRFVVQPPDPHRLDGDGDGIGCQG